MKKWFGYAAVGLILLGLSFSVVWSLYLDRRETGGSAVDISVIVYGSDSSDRWRSFTQGMRQACGELGLEAPVLTYAANPRRQVELLDREVEGGARGLIVTASSAQALEDFLMGLPPAVSVVAAESGAWDTLPAISADNRLMGREMADVLAQAEGTVAVLTENMGRDSVALRFEGFMERMEELGREVILLERGPEEDLVPFLASNLAVHIPNLDNLVLLDNETLETAIDAYPAAMVEARLYGIGSSSKVVHALDQGAVEAILFQNEYAMGYIAVMELAGEMGLGKNTAQGEIQHQVVTREVMYEPDVEKLLFPILQ